MTSSQHITGCVVARRETVGGALGLLRFFSLGIVLVTFLLTPFEAEAKRQRRKPSSMNSGTDFMRNPAQEAGEDNESEEDIYDPFADFSEFESRGEEQEDINFFKNGRMLTFGFQGGMINYTGEMAQKFQSSFRYGLFISYFFDLHFAIQLNWHVTDSPMSFRTYDSNLTGNASMNSLGFAIKYFLNTQNVTKGLADLNPYFLIGMATYNQSLRFTSLSGGIKDSGNGFSGGMGIEVPMLKKKLFWGAQLTYDMVGFKQENVPFTQTLPDGKQRDYGTSKGDLWNLLGCIGFNF